MSVSFRLPDELRPPVGPVHRDTGGALPNRDQIAAQILDALDCDSDSLSERSAALARILGNKGRTTLVLHVLAEHPMTMTRAARLARMSLPTASAAMGLAEQAGLVASVRSGRTRLAYPGPSRYVDSFLDMLLVSRADSAPKERNGTLVTCGTHFSGRLAGELMQKGLATGWIKRSRTGRIAASDRLGAYLERASGSRMDLPTGMICEEGKHAPHLGGALGAFLGDIAIEQGWISPSGAMWGPSLDLSLGY